MRRKLEERLLEWKERKTNRRPLLLYGARQTGKTWLLDDFGQRHYEQTVYIDLETNQAVADYFDGDLDPKRLISFFESVARTEIYPGKTLIILDEIQFCERAVTSLKYFCERAPEYHIVAAGSLLGVALNRERYSFPVGKVESITLYPLDFEEFLWALGEERLASSIREASITYEPLPEFLHQRAIELYRISLCVGGMPRCVAEYIEHGKLTLMPGFQNEITNNYVADMAKYASDAETVRIRACYNSMVAQLSKENRKFQYKVIQHGGSAAIFGVALEWLFQSGVALKCRRIEHAFMPIAAYEDLSAFKVYASDAGLLTMRAGLSHATILSGGANQFMGAVAENYIAQTLTACGYPLFYWTSSSSAELDFVMQKDEDIVGIEVKKGIQTRSRSLNAFMQKYDIPYAIRFSEKNFGQEGSIRSIPHYAAFCV